VKKEENRDVEMGSYLCSDFGYRRHLRLHWHCVRCGWHSEISIFRFCRIAGVGVVGRSDWFFFLTDRCFFNENEDYTMKSMQKILLATMTAGALVIGTVPGCAVTRDQSTAGEYVDDSAITAKVKTKFIESKQVDAAAITVETLKGTVQLSGFAKSSQEKSVAEQLAKEVKGVKAVKNDLLVRP
jgi:hypothetical protein